MLFEIALDIINDGEKLKGFRVHYREEKDTDPLFFPSKLAREVPIKTEEEAWELAEKFAAKTVGRFNDIYVVTQDCIAVKGYKEKTLNKRQD
jgi:hypothetical protein